MTGAGATETENPVTGPMPTILRGDARNLDLPDASVDLIVTSPPYFGLRSYRDGGEHYDGQIGAEATPVEFIDALIACTREWMRVLKPSGSIFVNLGDKYAWQTNGSLMFLPERYRIAAVDELGLIGRAVVIWEKLNPVPEGNVTDRVRRTHEDWVHFVRARRYFATIDNLREAHAEPNGRPAYGRPRPAVSGGNRGANVGTMDNAAHRDMGQHPLGKIPGSVWDVASQPFKAPESLGVAHAATFPMEWPRRFVLGWSPVGGVVLDPFGGTGTTALVAAMLGRRGISVDLSADYCRLAEWRASDPKERARAAGLDPDAVSAIKPELPGQSDLFDLLEGEAS